jgi:hypothetical protein
LPRSYRGMRPWESLVTPGGVESPSKRILGSHLYTNVATYRMIIRLGEYSPTLRPPGPGRRGACSGLSTAGIIMRHPGLSLLVLGRECFFPQPPHSKTVRPSELQSDLRPRRISFSPHGQSMTMLFEQSTKRSACGSSEPPHGYLLAERPVDRPRRRAT